jgi:hypothetical protein
MHSIVCLCMTTLTEVFLCFFLSCKANARVKPAKTGHSSDTPKLEDTTNPTTHGDWRLYVQN